MFSTVIDVIIAIAGLIGLVTLHEFGHFITAKKFGVKVEEFGIGFPPRLFGKQFGETLYSLNLLPLGAFVKMPGEIEYSDDPRSFFRRPIWQKALIVVAGVLSFWIMAAVIYSVFGIPTAIPDNLASSAAFQVIDPRVQIAQVAANSPAQQAGLEMGDIITGVGSPQIEKINNIKDLQNIVDEHEGQEVNLQIQRGRQFLTLQIEARANPPANQGPLGVELVRTATLVYPWWKAPWEGTLATFIQTRDIIVGYVGVIADLVHKAPTGVQLSGPVGIVQLGVKQIELGVRSFFQFLGMIAVYVAIFNVLPIPALDGGKLVFLGIEAAKRKPVSPKVEQVVTSVFFGLLIFVMIIVTVNDVLRIPFVHGLL